MINTKDLKSKYPPSYVLENVIGLKQSGSRRSTWIRYQYDSGRPALVCNDSTGVIVDHKGQAISPDGGNTTDIIGFVQKHFGISFRSAVEKITGEQVPEDYQIPEPEPPAKPDYSLRTLKIWNNNLLKYGQQFLMDRMISEEYAKMSLLGYRYKVEKGMVELGDGKFPLMSGWRIVFPTFRTKPKYNLIRINQRLDIAKARATYEKMDVKTKTLLSKLGDVDDVIDTLWRDKYLSKGSPIEPYHGWMIKKWNGEEWEYPRLQTMLICEGEIDAINLYEATGLPSIPSKKVFVSGAESVIIIGDNDEDGDGQKIAERTAFEFNRVGQESTIVFPYAEFKDVNDMARAGVLKDWLSENHIQTRS